MLRGSPAKPGGKEEANIPQEDEDLAIIITHFMSPQQFSYVMLMDVMASASLVLQREQELAKYCTKERNESTYLVNQKVIVEYKPTSPPKLVRGVVIKRKDDQYLVWIYDYGFPLRCSSLDMWPLPQILHTRFWEIKEGGIAYIKPITDKWSKSCLLAFNQMIHDAVYMNFKIEFQGQANRNFGNLKFKTASKIKVFQDAGEFLMCGKHALPAGTCRNTLQADSSSEAFSFELAEINEPLIESRSTLKNIMKLVLSSNDPYSQFVKNPSGVLASEQDPCNSLFGLNKGSGIFMKETLELRNHVQVPNSARIMRQKLLVSNESCVQSALEIPSIKKNPNNELISNKSSCVDTDQESVYEDAQPPFDEDFWKKMESLKRSSSTATSSEASFRTMKNAPQEASSNDSSDDYLSSESLNASRESLSLEEESPSKDLKSTFACQNAQEKSEKVEASSSSATSSDSSFFTMKNATQATSSYDSKSKKVEASTTASSLALGKGKTSSVPSILQNRLQNVSKATESKKIDQGNNDMALLAHSQQVVDPVGCLDELPFCQEICRSMRDLNICTMLPTQLYSWPHLLNGGSLVLVNGCATGRSWSYLPALCSTVLGSLQNSEFSRGLKLGPLAILLVDSVTRAKALTSNCASLMSRSDSKLHKLVNTHAYSLTACQTMLLNSCGILVTTPDHLLGLMGHEIDMIDPKMLEYFIVDDFDRLRLATPKALDKVLQKLSGLPTGPTMQFVVVAQHWHAKEFEKLLKLMPKPLALFGNFLEAAMYGGLRLKFSLKDFSRKADLLLKFLAEQKDFKKRTLVYCRHEKELNDLHRILNTAGHECVGPSEAQNQQPHQLLVVSDELEQLRTAVRNIEVLIHYSLPRTWSKFADRFSVMADQIPNYFTTTPQNGEKQPLLSYLLLDKSNFQEFTSLTKFLCAHGIEMDGTPWMDRQPHADDSIPYCPYLLSTGECVADCFKRHHFIPADMPPSGNPLQQEGTVIRCKLYKAYDPVHMAVWPLEYRTKGSTEWVDAPHSVHKWITTLEMSMGTDKKTHSPYRLGDVCIIHHQGHFKRVKIVDIQSRGPVIVQVMDYGTELVRVYSRHLLQCPEEKFTTLPPLAMDIRLSGVSAGRGKCLAKITEWVQQSLTGINDRQQMQITVDFAMLNVVYAKEVALVEQCPAMRSSVYKLLLHKELIKRGFGRMDSQSNHQLRGMREQQKKANEEVDNNKENFKLVTGKAYHCKNTTTCPSSTKIEPKKFLDTPKISKEKKPEPMKEVGERVQTKPKLAKANGEPKELPSTKAIDMLEENIASFPPEAADDQPSTSTAAFCNALMQELGTKSPSKNQDTHMFLESILEGIETIKQKKPTDQQELMELKEDAPQGASQGPAAKPVARSLQYSTISKGAVRPRVKWHQTKSHIELTIEQQVPEYELCLESKTLLYNVSTTSPPQHFVLQLLGEVRLVSQKQSGYYLKIKLAKVGILMDWPRLMESVYAQKHSPWLTYDVERAEEPSPPAGLVMWERYSRHQGNNDDYSSDDGDLLSDIYDPDVEHSDSGEIGDDC